MKVALLCALPSVNLVLDHVELRPLAPGEVRLRVACCGICGTDLHILGSMSYRPELPFVMGHEPAGIVTEAADEAGTHLLGSKVVAQVFAGCGACEWCDEGNHRLCESATATGVIGRWGGFAEYVSIPASTCVPIPDGVDFATAASLVDAGSTAANVWRTARSFLRAHDPVVVVVGAGPVGYFVAELAGANGCSPLVVETNPLRRSTIAEHGRHTRSSIDDVDRPPDVVIDCSGSPEVLPWGVAALSPRGVFVAAGYAVVPELDLAPLARKELRVVGVRSGSRSDLEHILNAVAVGTIRRPSITAWPLDQINEALAAVRKGEVAGKAVIAMSPTGCSERTEVPTWTS